MDARKMALASLAEVLLDARFEQVIVENFKRPTPYRITFDDCPDYVVRINIANILSKHDDFVEKLKMGMLDMVELSLSSQETAKDKVAVIADGYLFVFKSIARCITMTVRSQKPGRPRILGKWRE